MQLSKFFWSVSLIVPLLIAAPSWSASLRVCADPDYMPFSNKQGAGFENKIAAVVSTALGTKLQYYWSSYRGNGGFSEFLARTLDAGKCDVVINIPYGSQEEQTTDPYYASSYIFIFKKGKGYDVENMDSAVLRKVKIGFEEGTPPEEALKIRDLIFDAEAFHIGDDEGSSPASMLQAIQDGRVDVIITWEPAVGWFLKNYPDVRVVRVPNTRTMGSPEQYMFSMSMGVRKGDDTLCAKLNRVIATHKADLEDVLNQYDVKLYPTADDSP
ncbi:MAG TPA: quinoprotein dehydrogenase-associated putative ABC transporter substrate-binding protein [Candidatus Binataceae bacterium]|nr:quinoprotein dehydrogenase-associated putative ABC transporter substrate-binding protein [Candidatus Binataceae bacterium]